MVGEFHQDTQAQNVSSMTGKTLRMNSDGTVPSDNPFGSSSLDYAIGLRNSFGFDFDTFNNRLIATMAGPSSDDKILIITPGLTSAGPPASASATTPTSSTRQ